MFADMSSQIDAALAAGDAATAVAVARRALAAGDTDPFTRNLVAWQQAEDGDLEGAEAMARHGLATAPGDPGLLTTLGLSLRRQGRLSEALQAFDTAIAVAPDYPLAWLERGFALHQGSSLQLAEESYRRAAGLDPSRAQAFAGVAAIAAMRGDVAEARDFAARALVVDPDDAVAHCAVARCDIAAGAAADAVERLRWLLAKPALTVENHSAASSLLGDGLARLGDPAGAVTAYVAAKSDLAARFPHLAAAESHLHLTERIDAQVVAGSVRWQAPEPAGATRGLAFLLGYPRSGTTLVENVLASIAGVEALEELPTFAAAEAAFLVADGGAARLDQIDAATAEALRTAYWQRVGDFGIGPDARLFVDMDPMKTIDLPLIGRLFPHAPIIVMRRDPRDVVLSCFRQNFAASPIALEFTTLESTARHYDATMRLQRHCLSRIANPVLELRYEELVGDFDAVTRRLCAFVGLPWSETLRDFGETARRRNVNTASVGQVRKGLFNGGGQWRPFAGQMASALPILEPWVSAFGYES
jgi:tetratricopeptide (TPR) repeat protein